MLDILGCKDIFEIVNV